MTKITSSNEQHLDTYMRVVCIRVSFGEPCYIICQQNYRTPCVVADDTITIIQEIPKSNKNL